MGIDFHNVLTLSHQIFLIFFVNPRRFVVADGNGFSLELVHHDTVDSPGSPSTDIEKFRSLIRSSQSRERWLHSSTIVGSDDLNIRPIMTQEQFLYLVKLEIGGTIALLGFDTGSSLVWVQSDPCDPCFPHDGPNYKPGESSTFERLPADHHLCGGIYDGCTYEIRYNQGAVYTRGVLATEDFSFAKRIGAGVETFPLVFGSSDNNSVNFFENRRLVSGLFGLGTEEVSFMRQVGDRVDGLYAFCLVPVIAVGLNSFLRFGRDVIMIGAYQSTKLIPSFSYYLVTLEEISINGERLGFERETFASGGCLFDTGALATLMVRPAYDAIKDWLTKYFDGFGELTRIDYEGYEICYGMPAEFDQFPTIELHFEGPATLFLGRDQMIFIFYGRAQFCVLLAPSDSMSVLGATAMQNVHMVYDLQKEVVYFTVKECARM